jgi:hypothetical protein
MLKAKLEKLAKQDRRDAQRLRRKRSLTSMWKVRPQPQADRAPALEASDFDFIPAVWIAKTEEVREPSAS